MKKVRQLFPTICMILVLSLLYFSGWRLYQPVHTKVQEFLTPNIQERYNVVLNLYEDDELVATMDDTDSYIVPMASALSVSGIMIGIWILGSLLVRVAYHFEWSFYGVEKITKVAELFLIFAGIFIFIYQSESVGSHYGIYKEVFEEESVLNYYPVEKMPVISHLFDWDNVSIFRKALDTLIIKGDTITEFLQQFVAVSGAVLLPLKYCEKKEQERKKREKEKKKEQDFCAIVTDQVLRNLKKKNK